MASIKNIISVYLSIDESKPEEHKGIKIWIGNALTVRTLCYTANTAIYSRWVSCGDGITG